MSWAASRNLTKDEMQSLPYEKMERNALWVKNLRKSLEDKRNRHSCIAHGWQALCH